MSKIVFVLGAGASAESGAPLMSDFMYKAEKIYNNLDFNLDRNIYELVTKGQGILQNAIAKSAIDIYNIEHLFTAFEMASLFGRLGDLTQKEVSNLPHAMKRFIVDTIECSIAFPTVNGYLGPTDSYQKMATYLQKLKNESYITNWSDISIITFNYDLCIEIALTSLGIPFSYHITDSSKDKVSLFKLHGSFNWEYSVESGLKEKVSVTEIMRNLQPYNDSKKPLRLHTIIGDPYIVPPSWNKLYYHEKLERIWSEACKAFVDARNIIVLGYSFPPSDLLFQYLYAIGSMGVSVIKNFYYFDPSVQDLPKKLEPILGSSVLQRAKPMNLHFGRVFDTLETEHYLSQL
ncbi:hypothetical protein CH352_13435 [Leptospira hartskeerlii]|uniref:Uncharacterized protein n=1 Tax=Leptospira hartskeerlii TaxID=2023177 RepID=A0A2M9XA55_9LEPT|nr:SIR2 family protein [Leptospira hartskeerlii]PJZ24576.1 hypothetical protein CH357_16070 [Leptospira hartskeerlii]PJZ32811.1 hypothetical protein CH352_13435 [Leptospira hartskeerlii]